MLPMEIVSGINRWLSNRERKHLGPIERRNRRRHRAFAPWLSARVQNRRRYASPVVRWLWPEYCEIPCRECRSDTASTASLADMFRYREDFAGMSSEQTSCRGTGRNRRTSVCDDCRDNGGGGGRNGGGAERHQRKSGGGGGRGEGEGG